MVALTYILPSVGRGSLERAIDSVRRQRDVECELVVVFDGARPTVQPSADGMLRVVSRGTRMGPSAARNSGVRAARGDFVSFLDDDDVLSPEHAITSLTTLQGPVAGDVSVTGVAGKRDDEGHYLWERIPPLSSPRGRHWSLSPRIDWSSSLTKQGAVIRRVLFERIGGFSESVRRRQWSEFFWRLNEVSTVVGIQQILYFKTVYPANRRSAHLGGSGWGRWNDFGLLVQHSRELLCSHPRGFQRLVDEHHVRLKSDGHPFLAFLARHEIASLLESSTARCEACGE